MKPILIYCYDAWCGWCYGFSKTITRIADEYMDRFDVEVLSGGMIPIEYASHISKMSNYIKGAYKRVEELSGVQFGDDYLWHINNPDKSDWVPSSEKPAIALCVFKEYHPEKAVHLAADLQYALNFEGRDLTDDEAYRHLLDKYHISADDFYRKLHDAEYKERAYYEFALIKQLQVTGFPALLVQHDETKFYLVARGFTPYEIVKERLDNILKEISNHIES